MTKPGDSVPLLFLKPGEMVCSAQPLVVTTLLGSCVSVTMFSHRLRFGAICHALLPSCRQQQSCSYDWAEAGKYVECAIRHMLEEMTARGICRSEIEA